MHLYRSGLVFQSSIKEVQVVLPYHTKAYQSNDERSERLVTSDNSIQFLLQGGFEEYQSNYKPHYALVN